VAEQVEKISPDLVALAMRIGKVYTVRYEAVNAMLLNEFLKQHKKVEEQEATHQAALIYSRRAAESFHCASQRAGLENPSRERAAPTGGTVASGG
jgi:hypothetical protein